MNHTLKFATLALTLCLLTATGQLRAQITLIGYGQGCAGANAQVPAIGVSGQLGLGKTTNWNVYRAKTNAPAVLLFGVTELNVPSGGSCRLLLFPIVTAVTTTDGRGVGSVPVPLPFNNRLRGTTFLFQYFVVDRVGRAFGGSGSMTNGVRYRIQ